ncbi:Sphingomyelin phosphodiesterase [Fusarium keratoplasticum]|uniref:Sphingomyelin phosphodiesterase n=1 Tax=Fusarium keratoplasticum TaxID=1328300 RepID=A0ACC0QNG1_9HYPO|nr:Sphingomyelin phosphodiesterase [Fusarium keratoplasticum]KAI8657644.1 Sphingomyelin phosphodiesterase [Fusarium keratoplasticum]KAI8658608.1 Sphingomyelin phosphodiesterase [Fusarium keratoplasticum]
MRLSTAILTCLGLFGGRVLGSDGSANSPRGVTDAQKTLNGNDWADRIWEQRRGVSSCSGCQGLLLTFKGLAALGDRAFVDTVKDICKLSKVEDADVCDGTIELEGPIIAEALRNLVIGSKTSDLFCVTFLGLCKYPAVEPWVVPFPPKTLPRTRPAPSGQDPIKVVHYSDIHVDQMYTEGSNSECRKPICCRPYTEGDEPGNTDSPAGPYGEHTCDSPARLELSMYKAIKELVPDAAFSIFTGDVVDHAIWNTSIPYNEGQIVESYVNMDNHLGIVYGTAGNHEAHPTNAFQPNSIGNSSQWIYDLLSGIWSHWIGPKAAVTAEELGAYSARYPHGNLRVISLNTNLFYRGNFWLFQKDMLRDPSGQIEWLVRELDAAEKAGEHVYIIGHMPLGDRNAFHDQSHYLNEVVNRYSGTIAAMFYGHTHRDHFQITYADSSNKSFSNALLASYIGPSLTPMSGMPSFRVYDVDPVTFAVLDATTYSADMTSDTYQTQGPVWKKYYSAKETYGPLTNPPLTNPHAELTAGFWHNITERFETDQKAFDDFMLRMSRGWKQPECNEDCRETQICQLRAARSEDNCDVPTLGVYYQRRMEDSSERDECGISVMQATLSALVSKKGVLEMLQGLLLGKNLELFG